MPRPDLSDGRVVTIDSIATAIPRFTVPQVDAANFMLATAGLSDSLRNRIPAVYEKSGIDQRHTCLEDYTRTPDQFEFYPRPTDPQISPSTGARNRIYKRESVPLAAKAAKGCLESSGIASDQVTHLIVVSCTGFFAPGIDIELVMELGLPLTTQRTIIGFMGCYAAFNGLKSASAICRADPKANVVLVCVELCTLHFEFANTLENVIVNALFSDGAAACLISSCHPSESSGKLIYRDALSILANDSLDAMSWDIGDHGFSMGLSPKVPELIAKNLPGYIDQLTSRNGISASEIDFWAVHPGGRQVLDRTASTLSLSPEQMLDSYAVLREHGNMSSPTILFILQRIVSTRTASQGACGIALAFGPGLTIEGCLLEFGD